MVGDAHIQYIQTIHLHSIANWIRADLTENNDEIILRIRMERSDIGPVIVFFLFACFNAITSHSSVCVYVYKEVLNFAWGQVCLFYVTEAQKEQRNVKHQR